MSEHVDSAGDDRTANNAVRHQYRVLSETEKAQMTAIKDAGAALIKLIDEVGASAPPSPLPALGLNNLTIARLRAEEAVMWAVKHVTR